jgi:hypothetical protein
VHLERPGRGDATTIDIRIRDGKEAGVDIGEPLRIYTIEPVEDPVPRRTPPPAPPPQRPQEEPHPARSP